MPAIISQALQDALTLISAPLKDYPSDYDPLLEAMGEARFALLGEASHGTREFYRERAAITKRLIEEKGFIGVAVEADWPDAFRVNRFVRGEGDPLAGIDPLDGFRRFPEWMWRNSEILDFILWLRQWNDSLGPGRPKTGFYGLDLYSLYASMDAVLAYPEAIRLPGDGSQPQRNLWNERGPRPFALVRSRSDRSIAGASASGWKPGRFRSRRRRVLLRGAERPVGRGC